MRSEANTPWLLGLVAGLFLAGIVSASAATNEVFQSRSSRGDETPIKAELNQTPQTSVPQSTGLSPVLHRQIVTLNPDVEIEPADLARAYGLNPRHVFRHRFNNKRSDRHLFKGFAVSLDDAMIGRLKHDPRVKAVEPDSRIMPLIIATDQKPGVGLVRMGIPNFPLAHINEEYDPLNVDVAVMDTGIENTHPDISPAVYHYFGAESGMTGVDWYGHGTHVAGIIAGIDDDEGVVGVAPGVRLWSVQVVGPSPSATAYWSDFLAGLNYIADNADQISVVNVSLGPFDTNSPAEAVHSAIRSLVNQGVVFVAGAGNNSVPGNPQDIAGPDGIISQFDTDGNTISISPDDFIPASLPEVMAVSAMDPLNNVIASFSNCSKTPKVPSYVNSPGLGIDVAGPGVNILSTYLNVGSGYATLSGTSMAAPHVTGLVALYIAANGRATNAEGVYKIRQAIVDSAQPQSAWGVADTQDPDSNPEPLAVASTNWIPNPGITSAKKINGGFRMTFTAVPGYIYTPQVCDSLSSSNAWKTLFGMILGVSNTTEMTFVDSNASASQNFYRLVRSTPILMTNVKSNIYDPLELAAYGFAVGIGEPGVVGNSLRFFNPNLTTNGQGSYVDVSGGSYRFYINGFTIEFWAKPAQLVNDLICPAASLDSSQNSGNSRCGWIFYLTSSNQWQFNIGGTNGFVATVAGGTAQANVWQHIAGVYDGANISLYVNGQLAAGPVAASGFARNITQPLHFGAASDGSRTFDGWLDEPAIYTNALSAAQISAHFNAATANNAGYAAQILGDGPVGYWHFD